MNLMRGISWFAHLRGRRPARRRAPDLGDMGTTSALDEALPSLNDASRSVLRAGEGDDDPKHAVQRATRPARL